MSAPGVEQADWVEEQLAQLVNLAAGNQQAVTLTTHDPLINRPIPLEGCGCSPGGHLPGAVARRGVAP
jgi:hypothetical protein